MAGTPVDHLVQVAHVHGQSKLPAKLLSSQLATELILCLLLIDKHSPTHLTGTYRAVEFGYIFNLERMHNHL